MFYLFPFHKRFIFLTKPLLVSPQSRHLPLFFPLILDYFSSYRPLSPFLRSSYKSLPTFLPITPCLLFFLLLLAYISSYHSLPPFLPTTLCLHFITLCLLLFLPLHSCLLLFLPFLADFFLPLLDCFSEALLGYSTSH